MLGSGELNGPSKRTDDDPRSEQARALHATGPYLGIGLELAATLALFTLGGAWLDRRFGLTPWLTIAGAVLGITGAGLTLMRLVQRLDEKTAERKRKASK